MGIINNFFGSMLNAIFEGVIAVSPEYTLGIAIIVFTLVTRLLLTPLQLSQQRTSRGMSRLQPEMQRIQNKYKNKKDQESQAQYSQEVQALYKKYKINPVAGCLPLLIQFPIIIALFNVLREPAVYIKRLGNEYTNIAQTMMEKVPDYQTLLEGFKKAVTSSSRQQYDLTQTESLSKFLSHLNSGQWKEFLSKISGDAQTVLEQTLQTKQNVEMFFGVNLVDTPDMLIKSGMWLALLVPLISGASTFIFSKITMASTTSMQKTASDGSNNAQANTTESMMKTMNIMMPVMTAMFAYTMPIGLSVYWIAGNIIMMGQQWFVNKIVIRQEKILDEQFKKQEEVAQVAKKVIKKKVIKKVPVQKTSDVENDTTQNNDINGNNDSKDNQ